MMRSPAQSGAGDADPPRKPLLNVGPVLRQSDLLPKGMPYYPDWGIDWEAVHNAGQEEDEWV